MSTGLLSQLDANYSQIDEAQNPILPDEVATLVGSPVRELVPIPAAEPRRGWRIAVAAAIAVLVLVGGAVWLPRIIGSDRPVATTPSIESFSSLMWSRVPHDPVAFGEVNIESVTVGGPGLVAVGTDESADNGVPAVWTSVDGITWSRVPHDETVFGGAVLANVTAGGPGLVAVGGTDPHEGGPAAVWTSVDGITWSRVDHDEAIFGGTGEQNMTSVTVGGPGLVAVGWESAGFDADAAVWTSPDGITWTRVPHDEEVFGGSSYQAMWAVTAGGPGLVAVGEDRSGDFEDGDIAVWTSIDGITWSRVPHDEDVLGEGQVTSVTSGGAGLVAVGNVGTEEGDDAAVWISVDGVTWSRVPHDDTVFAKAGMQSVTAGGPGLIAVGGSESGAVVWTSVDGIAWTRVPHDEAIFGGTGEAGMVSVTFGGPGFVVVGRDDGNAAVWVAAPQS